MRIHFKFIIVSAVLGLLIALSQAGCDDILEEDITDEEVMILSPGDSITLDKNPISFQWDPVQGAVNYRLQVAEPDFIQAERLILDTLLESTRIALPVEVGKYQWRIKAENSAYSTPFTTYTFWLDTLGNE